MSDTRFYPFVIDNAAGQETIAGVGSDQAKYGVGVSSDFSISGNVGIGTTNTIDTFDGGFERRLVVCGGGAQVGSAYTFTGGDFRDAEDIIVAVTKTKSGGFAINCREQEVSATHPSKPVWTLRSYTNEPIAFGQGTSEIARFNEDGNLGIGTTTSTSPLTLFKEDPQYVGVTTALTLRTFRADMTSGNPAGGSIKFDNYDGNHGHEAFIEVIAPNSHSGGEAAREETADFNFKQTNNGTLNTRLTIQGETGLIKGTLHTLIGEHSAATNAGELFSFGNGATDNQGPAMPFAGEVVVVTISKSGGSDAGIFQPSKNGVTQGSASDQITTTTGSGTVTKNNADYSSLMDFVAGDRINYETIDGTDTTTCLTMFVRFNP